MSHALLLVAQVALSGANQNRCAGPPASAGQQQLLDRYAISLEDIGRDDLAPVWFDTDDPTMWATLQRRTN